MPVTIKLQEGEHGCQCQSFKKIYCEVLLNYVVQKKKDLKEEREKKGMVQEVALPTTWKTDLQHSLLFHYSKATAFKLKFLTCFYLVFFACHLPQTLIMLEEFYEVYTVFLLSNQSY